MLHSSVKPITILICIAGSMLLLMLYLFTNRNGLGLTPDSFAYLEQAQFFRETGSFRKEEVHPLFPFQTFLIIILSIFTDSDSGIFYMRVINGALLIGSFIALTLMATKILEKPVYVLLFSFTIVLSTPLLMVHSFLWTEPFFIFSVTVLIILIYQHTVKATLSTYVGLVVVFLFLCLQRKAGLLILTGTGLGFILFLNSQTHRWKVSVLILSVLIVAVLFKFYLIGEIPTLINFWGHLYGYVYFLSGWLLPISVLIWIRTAVLVLVLGLIIVSIFYQSADQKPAVFLKILFTIFSTYCIVRLFFYRPDPSEMDRYLSPVYPIFFLLLFMSIQTILQKAAWRIKRVAYALLFLWLLYPAIRTIKNAQLWHFRDAVSVSDLDKNQNLPL